MIGIVVTSHGPMADGLVESSKWFFGEQEQLKTLCLKDGQDLDEYDSLLLNTVKEVDSGEGVLILCDLLFGTPCNRAAMQINDKMNVVAGLNLGMLMELLAARPNYEGTLKEFATLAVEAGKKSIADVNALLNE